MGLLRIALSQLCATGYPKRLVPVEAYVLRHENVATAICRILPPIIEDVLTKGCFSEAETSEYEANERALLPFLEIIKRLIGNFWVCEIDGGKSDRAFFERCIIEGFARGRGILVQFMLDNFGVWFGLAQRKSDIHKAVNPSLIRVAVAKAESYGLYGIASALAEIIKDTNNSDRLHELARQYNQRIIFI